MENDMLVDNTPLENHLDEYGLLVKREDLCCPPPGPPFSKTRGVFAHVKSRPEEVIGVLDTFHSQAGHAVAQACSLLGKTCVNYYPRYKAAPGPHIAQNHAMGLGAQLQPLQAGRSAILYHQAKKDLGKIHDSYMMPNALKLPEMITETAAEVLRTIGGPDATPENIGELDLTGLVPDMPVLIAISSGTIAAGVIKGFNMAGLNPHFILHMGYQRSVEATAKYIREQSGIHNIHMSFVDEGYQYKNTARAGDTPPWACNAYYDLKAFRWWQREGRELHGKALMWNIG